MKRGCILQLLLSHNTLQFSFIGGVLGSIGGGIIGAKAGESTFNMVKTKIEEKQ